RDARDIEVPDGARPEAVRPDRARRLRLRSGEALAPAEEDVPPPGARVPARERELVDVFEGQPGLVDGDARGRRHVGDGRPVAGRAEAELTSVVRAPAP